MLPFAIMFAQSIPDISGKLSLLDMAGRWPALADEAEKSGDAVLVYETPTPPYSGEVRELSGVRPVDAERLRDGVGHFALSGLLGRSSAVTRHRAWAVRS